ncbi:hypothetical protein LEP1GSC188_3115 [Leptospira weilii serovar Topaz str. LT2116]|uniref:Uncharacterized protein n=1 Tax=Leptospira weilii serovar Topaz str. LT2116 TaxID=1088540 RepID=M3FKJ6_9LEPT|nr:hypothetical protein LEP1GSC188_3115 [Leptospira weilii serovar Topaz str. LT2116]
MEEEVSKLKRKVELITEIMNFLFLKLSNFITREEAITIKRALEKLKEE